MGSMKSIRILEPSGPLTVPPSEGKIDAFRPERGMVIDLMYSYIGNFRQNLNLKSEAPGGGKKKAGSKLTLLWLPGKTQWVRSREVQFRRVITPVGCGVLRSWMRRHICQLSFIGRYRGSCWQACYDPMLIKRGLPWMPLFSCGAFSIFYFGSPSEKMHAHPRSRSFKLDFKKSLF